MKKLAFIFSFLLWGSAVDAQKIEWITFDKLEVKMKEQPKKTLVYIYTDWCRYCLIQENKTFTDSAIASLLNDEYYCLKLNANELDSIHFLDKTYYGNSNSNHELAVKLGTKNNQLLLPTTVFFKSDLEIISIWQGLLKPTDLIQPN